MMKNNITLEQRAKQATAFKRRSMGSIMDYMAISIWIGLVELGIGRAFSWLAYTFYTWSVGTFWIGYKDYFNHPQHVC